MKALFRESQSFKQWWFWVLISLFAIFAIVSFVLQIVFGVKIGNNPISDMGLAITTSFVLLLVLFFTSLRLDTRMDRYGIHVRFYPISRNFKLYRWSEMHSVTVREYHPLKEYGGWGIRFGKNGKVLSISGKQGIQIEMKDGVRLLIGTHKSQEAQKVIEECF